MPFNVPDDQKPTFNKEVKSSLELLAGGIDQTLGQWEMLQPETLVEEYQKPIKTQVVERLTPLEEEVYRPIQAGAPAAEGEVISAEPIRQDSVSLQPEQERVAPIVREYQAPMREDIMSISPYQQAVADATSAQVDSLRNEAGELPKSAVEVFSKPFNENSIKALGMVDGDGNPTEKGELFYNLSEAGMFDESGVLTKKGQAYLTPISEMSKPEWFNQQGSKDTFDILWNDGVIRASSTPSEAIGSVVDFVGTAIYGGAELTRQQALRFAHSSRTWSGQLKTYDPKGKELEAELATSDLAVSENMYKNAINLSNATNVALANDRKFIEESILSPIIGAVGNVTGIKKLQEYALDLENPNIKSTEDALVTARYKQWATDQRLADMEAGEIAETVLGLEGSLQRATDAKEQLGENDFNKIYKGVGAFTSIVGDPLNLVPARIAFGAARTAPLATRLQLTAQKTMGRISQMELAIAKGETAVQSSMAALAKSDPTISLAQRMAVDFAERAKQQPALLEKSARASQIANRTINEANQIRSALPAITSELESLVAKRNSLATRIPESYAQKMLQTMEIGRQARSVPAKAIGATLERVGNALSKTDDAVTNFLKDRGFDQMYTAAVGAAGVAGMAGSPIIGAVAAGAAALKTGKVLSSYGKLFRYVGKEMENVRGQIPFWKRVASHTAPNSLGRGIAHSFNMLDLGGVTSDVLRRTGRGIAAAAPTDLMFEYLSDGADMRPETLYQAAAESLVIGGSFAAAGGAFMGTKKRMRELSIGDELNFKRDLVDPRQKALFEAIPSGTRSAIATYSIANPTLNYQFKDSGASQYDPNTNTATINVKSTNPIKALVAHETLHHTIIKNNMESGISALFLGDMKGNTVGGLFRSRDGKLDPNFQAFKDAYYNRLGVAEMSNAERDAVYPLDKVAVEYFIEKHSDQYSAMAESGELGAIASSGAARRKLGSILETILPRVPVLRDLHFKSGGIIDKNGSWVTGNGILDAEGIKTDPITNKMFRDMNRRSAGLATGQFEPLISDKADSGASIILNPSDSIDLELLHPLVKTDENGKPILENGRAVALDKATEMERALAGLTVNEVLRRKRSENYAPEKGEAYIDDNNQFQSGWLPDDVVSEMFAKNRFNPEQKRIIREMNRLVRKGTGDRVVMINFPATTRNKSGKAVYKPQDATLRDTVPVAILTSKDGNLQFGLMSVTKLQENIQKRSQGARGKRLYSGNVDLILRDTQAMMDFHKNGVDSIEYFSEKYGAVEADQRKKFINTMFGLLNQKEQAVLNPMLLEDGVKSRDNVYRTYRADRVSKAVPMSPQDYPAMPFSYKATSQVLLPEQARQMPESQSQVEDTTVDDRLKLLQTKEVLQDWAMTQESWKDWYSEHQETLDDFFGDNAELFQEILAVTSQAASVKANVGLALKAFGQLMRGEEFDARLRGEEKAGYLPAVIGNLNAIKNKTQVGGRKISNYKSANEGDSSKVVVDRHIARMLFGVDTPSAKQYAEAERVLTDIAKELGWKPAQVQAALWAQSIVMSGKTPVSYGSYLRQLESKGLTKKELINGIKGNQITRRTGEIAGSSYGRDATSKERGRYSPSVQDASGRGKESVSYLPEQARQMPEPITGKTKRIPEVTEAAQKFKEGKITSQEYNAIVDQYMPLKAFGRVLEPASTSDILRGLGDRKAGERYKKDMVKNPEDIPAGQRLESRLDIPAYESEGVYINALHEPRKDVNKGGAGTAVGYTATTVMDNVNFGVTEKAAENIAAGKPKGTIATMQGDYVPMTVKQAHSLAKEVINNPKWTEVGMNPIRHSYFYDKATQMPIESAKRVVQIGALVLAKDAVKEDKSKYRYMPEAEDKPVKIVGKANELTVQGTPAPKTSVKTIPLSGKLIQWDEELKTGARYMPEYQPSAFPIITPEILASIEKETPTLAAIHIDRMRVGNYMGVDLQGGMYYPAITENLEKQVLWAFNSKGVARTVAARAAENGGYVKLVLMQEGNVVGNKTFNDIWFEVLNRSIKANKISKGEALSKLNEMRERVYKKLSSKDSKRNPWILDHSKEWESISEASEAIRSMPQIERGSTYFQKTKVMTKSAGEKMSYQALLSKKMTKAGFPDAEEIVENIEEPAFKGVPSGSAVAILKFNPLEEGADIMTAKDAGVTEHRSYGYVLHGVPVAKINHYQVVDRTFPSTKNQIMTQQHTNFPVRKSIPSESLSHGTIKYAPEKSTAKIKSSAASISSVAKMK